MRGRPVHELYGRGGVRKAGIMFGFSSKPVKTRGQLMREEMGTGWEHFVQAANLAASGVGATVGPTTGKMRTAATRSMDTTMSALAPLAAAYREGAADATRAAMKSSALKKESKMSRKNTGMLIGLLAAGAAVGVAGALVMRRRKHQQWSEYDPSEALEGIKSDSRSMLHKASDKASSAIDKAGTQAGRMMDRGSDKMSSASSSIRDTRDEMKSKTESAAEDANDATDNFLSKSSQSGKNSRM